MIKLKDLLKERIISVVNKQYHTINEELTAYHASPSKFDKFEISKIGSGIGKQFSGWGIYLSNKKEVVKDYGKYLYQTTLFKGKSSKQDTAKEIKQKKYGSDKYPTVLIKHFGIQLRKLGKITDAQLHQLISKESLKTIWNETDFVFKILNKQKK